MERFNYKGGCGVCGCMCIEAFKQTADLGYKINGFRLLVI